MTRQYWKWLVAGVAAVGLQFGAAAAAEASPPRIVIVVGAKAPALERLAAAELETMLERLYEADVVVGNTSDPESRAQILVGRPTSNPIIDRTMGDSWPELTDQGLLLRRLDHSVPTLVVGGGGPVAVLWSGYELGERLGVRYLHNRDVYPQRRGWPGLPDLDQVMEPNIRVRCWRLVNDLAHGPVSWSLEENRRFIRQIAKMKYNRIHTYLWPQQPFVHYSFRGMHKPPGVLYFGQKHSIDNDMIGLREVHGYEGVYQPGVCWRGHSRRASQTGSYPG